MCSTGCAGFFTSESSVAGRAITKTPAVLLVHGKTRPKMGKEKTVHATSTLTHPNVFTELLPPCSMGLCSAPCEVSKPCAQVLLYLFDFLWDGKLQIPLQSMFSVFSCLTRDIEDSEMTIRSKEVQFCCVLQKMHFKNLLRTLNILKSFRLQIIALHKCFIDTEAALKVLINAYIPLEYVQLSDWREQKQT